MTLEEIRTEKTAFENKISQLLREFNDKTGTSIIGIDILSEVNPINGLATIYRVDARVVV